MHGCRYSHTQPHIDIAMYVVTIAIRSISLSLQIYVYYVKHYDRRFPNKNYLTTHRDAEFLLRRYDYTAQGVVMPGINRFDHTFTTKVLLVVKLCSVG